MGAENDYIAQMVSETFEIIEKKVLPLKKKNRQSEMTFEGPVLLLDQERDCLVLKAFGSELEIPLTWSIFQSSESIKCDKESDANHLLEVMEVAFGRELQSIEIFNKNGQWSISIEESNIADKAA